MLFIEKKCNANLLYINSLKNIFFIYFSYLLIFEILLRDMVVQSLV